MCGSTSASRARECGISSAPGPHRFECNPSIEWGGIAAARTNANAQASDYGPLARGSESPHKPRHNFPSAKHTVVLEFTKQMQNHSPSPLLLRHTYGWGSACVGHASVGGRNSRAGKIHSESGAGTGPGSLTGGAVTSRSCRHRPTRSNSLHCCCCRCCYRPNCHQRSSDCRRILFDTDCRTDSQSHAWCGCVSFFCCVCVLCLLTCHTALLTAKRQGCGTFAPHSLSLLRRFWKRKMEASTRNSFTVGTFHKNPPTKLINPTAQKIEPPARARCHSTSLTVYLSLSCAAKSLQNASSPITKPCFILARKRTNQPYKL